MTYLKFMGSVGKKSKLRVLLIEDDNADAELIMHELEASSIAFSIARVQTEDEFREELAKELPDVILSDHGLPSFSGFRALGLTRAEYPQLPFIFVSGSNDQGMVAQMHEEGATDYVFKRDIGDLKTAVLQALEDEPEMPPPIPVVKESETRQPRQTAYDEVVTAIAFQATMQPDTSQTMSASSAHLYFCPRCHYAHDELGNAVRLEDYCGAREEIVVSRQLCAICARL